MTKAEGNPMETDEILNMCRLCAEIVLTKPLLPLFTENKEERIVTKQVNLLIDSLISPDDGLPQKACARCVENVAKCFSFITNVVSTQNKLRQIVQVPELKKVNGTGGRWNQFLTNNQLVRVTNTDVGLRKRRDENSSLIDFYLKTSPPKNVFKSINETAHATLSTFEIVPEKRIKNATGEAQSCEGTSSLYSSSTLRRLRLYRCGVCHEKYRVKDDCLRHIIDLHPEVKKPVSPGTIFEAVHKPSVSEKNNPNKNGLSANDRSSNLSTLLRKCEDETITSRSVSGSIKKNLSLQVNKSKLRKRLSGTRRKVLAIESFYKQVHKRCTRYTCDVCGRLMASQFAFERHLHEHNDEDDKYNSNDKNDNDNKNKKPRSSTPLKAISGFCKKCRRRVPNFARHKIYHKIRALEYKNSKMKHVRKA